MVYHCHHHHHHHHVCGLLRDSAGNCYGYGYDDDHGHVDDGDGACDDGSDSSVMPFLSQRAEPILAKWSHEGPFCKNWLRVPLNVSLGAQHYDLYSAGASANLGHTDSAELSLGHAARSRRRPLGASSGLGAPIQTELHAS